MARNAVMSKVANVIMTSTGTLDKPSEKPTNYAYHDQQESSSDVTCSFVDSINYYCQWWFKDHIRHVIAHYTLPIIHCTMPHYIPVQVGAGHMGNQRSNFFRHRGI